MHLWVDRRAALALSSSSDSSHAVASHSCICQPRHGVHWSCLQAKKAGFKQPEVNDGLIEVVGLTSGYQAGAVMSGVMHAVRLAQTAGARVRVSGPAGGRKQSTQGRDSMATGGGRKTISVYLQLDGEPWRQDAPAGDGECLEARLSICDRFCACSGAVCVPALPERGEPLGTALLSSTWAARACAWPWQRS
jgi:Diacylglycerol kinase accessory domain